MTYNTVRFICSFEIPAACWFAQKESSIMAEGSLLWEICKEIQEIKSLDVFLTGQCWATMSCAGSSCTPTIWRMWTCSLAQFYSVPTDNHSPCHGVIMYCVLRILDLSYGKCDTFQKASRMQCRAGVLQCSPVDIGLLACPE